MAKTKRKRRKKHRGTQTGRVAPASGRPRSREEAKAQARSRQGKGKGKGTARRPARGLTPPTWTGALGKGALASLLFFGLFAGLFHRPIGASAGFAAFMLAFYVPMSYYLDSFFYRRRMRQQQGGTE